MHYVYLLMSMKYNETYIGSTNDLRRRFKEHNTSKEISTKCYLPWVLVYYEVYNMEKLARLREKRLKHNGNAVRELKKRVGLLPKEGLHPAPLFLVKKSGAGFTLIETLVYVGILIMVIVSVVGYSMSLSGARNKNYSAQNVQANSRVALDIMSEKIRASSSVVIPAAGAGSNQLILDMPGAAPDITFSVSGGRLIMAKAGNPDEYITDSRTAVTDLIFTNTALSGERDIVNIQADISYAAAAGDIENSYSQQLRTSVSRRK